MDIGLSYNETSPRWVGKFIDFFSRINISLRNKLLIFFFTVIILLVGVNSMLFLEVMKFNQQYDTIITNITTANNINAFIKPAIDTEMWDIVAGKKEFGEGNQYAIIGEVESQISDMIQNTASDKSQIKLEVILRTLGTLTNYVNKMGDQIAMGSLVAENERVLDNIRGVSEVVEETIQDYMLFEVNEAEQQYLEMQKRFNHWSILYFVLLPCVVAFSIGAAWLISASIYIPIKKLQDLSTTITKNDLQALVSNENVDEITELGMSFNIMIGKIRELLDAKVLEQENLKKAELKALQAQINPHFLYNTLDTIVWMSESNQSEQVIKIVKALSSFFRIALSRGKDWISIRQEVEHVRSYLYIQKIRYRDILNYQIDVDECILESTILKLTLQPIVENALYHGIKNKRDGGTIWVRAKKAGDDFVMLEVQDNGVGFTPYKLDQVRTSFNNDSNRILKNETGFGLENVHKRIQLYYGDQYGLQVDSKYQEGTKIVVLIPFQRDTEIYSHSKEGVNVH